MSWIYLLKDRGHIYDVLRTFITEIKNQFAITSKNLRTNNALEFVQSKIASYCASLGIIHQTSCPHIFQQNGVAERKYRHILDVTRTIMLHMHVPKYLWSDAVLTATYLINRMHSAPLGDEVPLRRLKPDTHLFTLPPQVFWCVTFVQDLSPNLDKQSPRSIKCIFMGSSRTQRGYRCFHSPTRRYFVSTDSTLTQRK